LWSFPALLLLFISLFFFFGEIEEGGRLALNSRRRTYCGLSVAAVVEVKASSKAICVVCRRNHCFLQTVA
jgi:hypothetical protein